MLSSSPMSHVSLLSICLILFLFIFYILYFIFYILYFIFYILYFIFYILYFIFYILYFIFYILYFTFYILHFTFYIYILYFIFYNIYFVSMYLCIFVSLYFCIFIVHFIFIFYFLQVCCFDVTKVQTLYTTATSTRTLNSHASPPAPTLPRISPLTDMATYYLLVLLLRQATLPLLDMYTTDRHRSASLVRPDKRDSLYSHRSTSSYNVSNMYALHIFIKTEI